MSEIIDIIKERRSIRNYIADRDVEKDKLDVLLESIKWAPSWANTQCWEIVIVRDPERKKKLQKTLPKGNPAYSAIYDAPVVFVFCAQLKKAGYYKGSAATKFGDWFMFDLGIAVQSFCLTAHSIGLGTVIVGLFDHEQAKKILNVPDGYEVVVLVPVGYPKKIPLAPKRKDVKDFVHYEIF